MVAPGHSIAKENVKIEAATQTYATITLQNYFRMYHKLAGMTGTAETEAAELWSIYKLDVVTIPTHLKMVRDDKQDLCLQNQARKTKAVIEEIEALRNAGRPVLVGTTSVEISELLSRMLQQKKIPHNVLNAKQHAKGSAGLSPARVCPVPYHRHQHGGSWYRYHRPRRKKKPAVWQLLKTGKA